MRGQTESRVDFGPPAKKEEIVQRLGEYETTGLTPERIKWIMDQLYSARWVAVEDGERTKGTWEKKFGECNCSVCGQRPYPYQTDSSEDDYWTPNFCPNCGADMREEVR